MTKTLSALSLVFRCCFPHYAFESTSPWRLTRMKKVRLAIAHKRQNPSSHNHPIVDIYSTANTEFMFGGILLFHLHHVCVHEGAETHHMLLYTECMINKINFEIILKLLFGCERYCWDLVGVWGMEHSSNTIIRNDKLIKFDNKLVIPLLWQEWVHICLFGRRQSLKACLLIFNSGSQTCSSFVVILIYMPFSAIWITRCWCSCNIPFSSLSHQRSESTATA